MKRLVAMVLLGIHLFSIGGYSLVYQYYIHQSDVRIVKQIFDNKVSDSKLVEIKVPVNMPTVQDWTEYEVIEGQIKIKDTYYNYVKLKMTRDTMYLVCLPNAVKTRLTKASAVTTKDFSDVPAGKKGHEAPVKKINTITEFNIPAFCYEYAGFETYVKAESSNLRFKLDKPFIESPGKPPNFSS